MLYAGRLDANDIPEVDHMRRVAAGVSEGARVVAWLHDAVEDRRVALTDLARRCSLSADEIDAISLLTRADASEPYERYVERIATAPGEAGRVAREVKRSDLRANLARPVNPDTRHLRARYEAALRRLQSRSSG